MTNFTQRGRIRSIGAVVGVSIALLLVLGIILTGTGISDYLFLTGCVGATIILVTLAAMKLGTDKVRGIRDFVAATATLLTGLVSFFWEHYAWFLMAIGILCFAYAILEVHLRRSGPPRQPQ